MGEENDGQVGSGYGSRDTEVQVHDAIWCREYHGAHGDDGGCMVDGDLCGFSDQGVIVEVGETSRSHDDE